MAVFRSKYVNLPVVVLLVCIVLVTLTVTYFHYDHWGDVWKDKSVVLSKVKPSVVRRPLVVQNKDVIFLRQHDYKPKSTFTKTDIGQMSDKEVAYVYHSYLDNIDMVCRRKLRMGNAGDGGWEVCDDDEYQPAASCIVYSFGINNDFSFDDDVAAAYGCQVYAFDPSMSKEADVVKRSEQVTFYKIGLHSTDTLMKRPGGKTWTMKTLTSIKAQLQHKDAILDVLKMDIEHSEWAALAQIVQSGELARVRQLMVEFHTNKNRKHFRNSLSLFRGIEEAGFRRFHTHMNHYCGPVSNKEFYAIRRTTCMEIYFLNINMARQIVN